MQRLATLAWKNQIEVRDLETELPEEYIKLMNDFEFARAFDYVWNRIQNVNKSIDEEKPWSLAKNGEVEKLNACMGELISELLNIAQMLSPFMPLTAEKIEAIFKNPIMPPETPLFVKNK